MQPNFLFALVGETFLVAGCNEKSNLSQHVVDNILFDKKIIRESGHINLRRSMPRTWLQLTNRK